MANAKFNLSLPSNEPIKSYAPGTLERRDIKAKLKELKAQQIEIPYPCRYVQPSQDSQHLVLQRQ